MRPRIESHMLRIILAVICVFPALGYASKSCDEVVSSISAKVSKEKVLCMSDGGCVQEITAALPKSNLTITNSIRPWVEEGDQVTILKLKGVYFPRPSYRGGKAGQQSYVYKLARYCGTS